MGYVAPKIKFDGEKFDGNKSGEVGYEFTQIPNRILSYVMRNIDGKCGNRLKLMIFLMGCGENFEIHEKTVLKRTGMSQASYSQAREWLDKNGFITYKKSCENAIIKINYAYMWSEIRQEEQDELIEKLENSNRNSEKIENEYRESVVIGNREWTWNTFYICESLSKDGNDEYSKYKVDKETLRKELKKYLGESPRDSAEKRYSI